MISQQGWIRVVILKKENSFSTLTFFPFTPKLMVFFFCQHPFSSCNLISEPFVCLYSWELKSYLHGITQSSIYSVIYLTMAIDHDWRLEKALNRRLHYSTITLSLFIGLASPLCWDQSRRACVYPAKVIRRRSIVELFKMVLTSTLTLTSLTLTPDLWPWCCL